MPEEGEESTHATQCIIICEQHSLKGDPAFYFINYTVGHKKRATFIFLLTLANIDGFS